LFEVSPNKVIRDALGFGWDLEELQRKNRLKIIFTSPQVLSQELRSPDSLLLEAAAGIGAQRIFIDGASLLRIVSDTNGGGTYRELLLHLIEGLERENLTAMLSQEAIAREELATTLEVSEFLADTVIVLRHEPHERRVHRSLEIKKSRGQDFDGGLHTLRITSGKGLEVFRRVQARSRDPEKQPTSLAKSSVSGCGPLDTLLGGGVFAGSTTMVVGVSGVGKTVLGVQLLVEGAEKQNQRGLLVSLDEHPAQISRNAATLGLNLEKHIESGMIQVIYESPQELEIDPHFDRICRTIEEHNIERLLIDGMTSYSAAVTDQRLYRDFFHALVNYTKRRLMTTFFNYENPELFGLTHFMPDFAVSSIVDNLILMNLVELGSTLHRAITVAKARGCAHQFDTREFTIDQGGITLIPLKEAQALTPLPLQSYYGLLSRAPTRLSPALKQKGAASE
jgi:circadian clock protein KaiC